MSTASEVKNFFKGTNVLITGVTGFLGKLLLHKILTTCDVSRIFVIIRIKRKDKAISERLRDIFDDSLFASLKESKPQCLSKVHPIEADFSDENAFHFSTEIETMLLDNVNIVFHSAARLNMSWSLKNSIQTNVRGVKNILDFCSQMKQLKVFIFVSTLYSTCEREVIEEKIVRRKVSARCLLEVVKDTSEEAIEELKPCLIGESPNIYCYTKALSEEVVSQYAKNLPIGIFRPGIVTSTYKDPVPGWISSANSLPGIMYAIMTGLMKVSYGRRDTLIDFVPADMCINAMICCAWDTFKRLNNNDNNKNAYDMIIYNFSNNWNERMTWDQMRRGHLDNIKYAFSNSLWAPFNILTPKPWLYKTLWWSWHVLPARVYDFFTSIKGKPSKMVKLYQKLEQFQGILVYFNLHQWIFKRENVEAMWNSMSEEDKKTFGFDMRNIQYDKYFAAVNYGMKKYLSKDDMTNLEKDARKLEKLKLLHKITVLSCSIFFVFSFTKFLKMYRGYKRT